MGKSHPLVRVVFKLRPDFAVLFASPRAGVPVLRICTSDVGCEEAMKSLEDRSGYKIHYDKA